MANRLQQILKDVISDTQIGFVPGRNITEEFIYAQQVITRSTMQHRSIALLKLDIYKAFNMISWHFINDILKAKRFPEAWVKLLGRTMLT
jgi:Reverse transcriptase (RNA-dependent DNA polymerase)